MHGSGEPCYEWSKPWSVPLSLSFSTGRALRHRPAWTAAVAWEVDLVAQEVDRSIAERELSPAGMPAPELGGIDQIVERPKRRPQDEMIPTVRIRRDARPVRLLPDLDSLAHGEHVRQAVQNVGLTDTCVTRHQSAVRGPGSRPIDLVPVVAHVTRRGTVRQRRNRPKFGRGRAGSAIAQPRVGWTTIDRKDGLGQLHVLDSPSIRNVAAEVELVVQRALFYVRQQERAPGKRIAADPARRVASDGRMIVVQGQPDLPQVVLALGSAGPLPARPVWPAAAGRPESR